MSHNKTSSGGIGFTGALLIAFIVLKLCNVITWSWWWVLSPAWVVAGSVLIIIGVQWLMISLEMRKTKKFVDKNGKMFSKWEERLDQMQEAKRKADAIRNQKALDEKLTKDNGNKFRANNIV